MTARSRSMLVLLTGVFASIAVRGQPATPGGAPAAAPAPANVWHDESIAATELVRIRFPTDSGLLSHSAIEVLLNGAAVRAAAAKEALELSPDDAATAIDIEFYAPEGIVSALSKDDTGSTLIGVLTVRARRSSGATMESLGALVTRLCVRAERLLSALIVPERNTLEEEKRSLQEQLEAATTEATSTRAAKAELLGIAGNIDISSGERVADQFAQLTDRVNALEQEIAALEARRRALGEQIARVSAEVEQAIANDAAVAELAKVVALRDQRLGLRRTMHAAGNVGDAEVAEAEEQVALARAELARYKQQVAQNVGGGLLSRLNEELVMLAVQMVEIDVRRTTVAEQLTRYREAGELARRYSNVSAMVLHADLLVQELRHSLANIDERLAGPPARVEITVIGAAAAPGAGSGNP